jgi:penicillin-binding protein 1A
MTLPDRKQVLYTTLSILVVLVVIAFAKLAHIYNNELPSLEQLHNIEPSLTTTIYDRNGEVIHEFYLQRRILVPLKKMPPALIEALLSTEDQRFYKHWGVDAQGILRALFRNILKGNLTGQGGSTITQQLSRTLFLTREKVISRKIKEALTAIKIERTYSKNEILEMYFNQCNFGKGAYGIQAAAQLYFNKDVEELTVSDCAVLVGLLPAPNRYSPLNNPEYSLTRRNVVLGRLAATRKLTEDEADSLQVLPLELNPNPVKLGKAHYFSEMVRQYIEKKYGDKALYSEGLAIYTTLDSKLQDQAEKQLFAMVDELQQQMQARKTLKNQQYTIVYLDSSGEKPVWRRKYKQLQGALVTMDNSKGDILALIGGRDFDETKFNRATQALRQPGSAFKPFVYTAAIESGLHPSDIMFDTPVVLENRPGEEWRPRNYDRQFRGPLTLREGLADSRNLVAIKLLQKLSPQAAVDYAHKLGISTELFPYPSIAIGTSEVTLWQMTRAFSVFPNQGVLVEPRYVLKIVDRYGNLLEENRSTKKELVLDRRTAYIVTSMMQSVIDGGTGYAVRARGFSRPAGGKTGTTDETTDNWFIGFVPQMTAGIWLGFDDKTPIGSNMTGGTTAAVVWGEFMKSACQNLPVLDFAKPEGVFYETVCWETGELATRNCDKTVTDLFTEQTVPKRKCSLHSRSGFDPF